ncbi:MAG: hypothetical protein AAGI28_13150 [Pseudomonadota bacterium]
MIEFANPGWLRPAFALNILILVPVCYSMFLGNGVASVFDGLVDESAGLRLMTGSLWFAILLASVAGLAWPAFFAPIMMAQVVYKALWLAVFVLPAFQHSGWSAVPIGISACFAFIVVTYPVLLFLATRS